MSALPVRPAGRSGGGRPVLLVAAALLSAAAALAIGILLFGHFGETEGRILGTTAALGGYWLLALPATLLRDRRRLPALAAAVVALDLAAAALVVGAIWSGGDSEAAGRAVAAVNAWLVAAALVAALAARRSAQDPPVVGRLLAASAVLATACAAMVTALVAARFEREGYVRGLAALVVLLALLAALQPVLARARPVRSVHRLRVATAGGTVELALEARDRAEAAARAIRSVEGEGGRVLGIELADDEPG